MRAQDTFIALSRRMYNTSNVYAVCVHKERTKEWIERIHKIDSNLLRSAARSTIYFLLHFRLASDNGDRVNRTCRWCCFASVQLCKSRRMYFNLTEIHDSSIHFILPSSNMCHELSLHLWSEFRWNGNKMFIAESPREMLLRWRRWLTLECTLDGVGCASATNDPNGNASSSWICKGI